MLSAMAVLLVSLPLLSGCKDETATAAYTPPPPPAVTVSLPHARAVTNYAEFTGTTEALESVEIRARVEGYLEKIHFDPGALVKKGDILFTIDPAEYNARLDEAKADLAIREAEYRSVAVTLKRKENAYKDRAVSEVEVIEARAELDKAKASIKASKAAVRTSRLKLSYTRIKAPISGRISRRLVDEGNLVGAGERTLLASIVRDDSVYAYFSLNERELIQYRENRAKALSSGEERNETVMHLGLAGKRDYPFEGTVDYLDTRVDADTGTITVRGIFKNPDHRLMPGLFARIRIPVGHMDAALTVPDTAVGRDQQGNYLLLVNKENKVDYRPVKIGIRVEDRRVIESGLSAQDRVIVKGLQKVRPGVPVTPVEDKGAAAAAPPARVAEAEGAPANG